MERLARLPRAEQDAVLAPAIRLCRPGELARFVAWIVDHPDPPPRSVRRLLARWSELGPDDRHDLLERESACLWRHLRAMRVHAGEAPRRAAIAISAHLVERWLTEASPEPMCLLPDLTLLAEIDALLALGAESLPETRDEHLARVLALAHRRPGPILGAWLDDASRPGHMILRRQARRLPPDVRAAMCTRWLRVAALRPVAIDEIESSARGALLRDAHLLALGGRSAALRRLARPADAIPRVAPAPGEPRRRLLHRLLEALPVDEPVRVEHLGVGAEADPDPAVRFRCIDALSRREASPGIDDVLARALSDTDPCVSARSIGALGEARSPARVRALLPRLRLARNSTHRRVAMRARSLGALWDPLDALSHDAPALRCPVGARRALASDRTRFVESLRDVFAEGDPARTVGALRLAARLGVLDEVEHEVFRAARGNDPRVAATAIGLLDRIAGESAIRCVRSALAHADGRVRANAVESLARRQPDAPELVVLRRDDTPRVRANAVRHGVTHAGLRGVDPRAEIEPMLTDTRPAHRASGLWVAERTACVSVASTVARLAREETDPCAARRATRCARRILCELERRERDPLPLARAG